MNDEALSYINICEYIIYILTSDLVPMSYKYKLILVKYI